MPDFDAITPPLSLFSLILMPPLYYASDIDAAMPLYFILPFRHYFRRRATIFIDATIRHDYAIIDSRHDYC